MGEDHEKMKKVVTMYVDVGNLISPIQLSTLISRLSMKDRDLKVLTKLGYQQEQEELTLIIVITQMLIMEGISQINL